MDVKETYQNIIDSAKPHIQLAQEKTIAFFTDIYERFQRLGNWRIAIILIVILGIFILMFGGSTPEEAVVNPPPEPQSQQPQENPLEDPVIQRILLIGLILLFLWLVVLLIYDVGKITLSLQSIAHRRNVLFAFSVIILAEVFVIDISAMLGLQLGEMAETNTTNEVTTQTSTKKNDLNRYAYGVLGFFLIYSFIEYVFTFASDYFKSRDDWNAKKSESKTEGGISIFIIGIYRAFFDVILPILALLYVCFFVFEHTSKFVDVAAKTIVCSPKKLTKLEKKQDEINSSIEEIAGMCPKCDPAIQDLKKGLELLSGDKQLSVKDWFNCN